MVRVCCVKSAAFTIPSTRQHGSRGNIPGWSEFVMLSLLPPPFLVLGSVGLGVLFLVGQSLLF